MNRMELRELSAERVRAARALLDAKLWSGAYYLVGYSVECGLKAAILAHVERSGAIFDDRDFSKKCWTHDLEDLIDIADLEQVLTQSSGLNPELKQNWTTTKDWNETARYKFWSESQALKLYHAVADENNGVLRWVTAHY